MSINRRDFLTFISRTFVAVPFLWSLPFSRSEARIPPREPNEPEPDEPIVKAEVESPDLDRAELESAPIPSNAGQKEAYLATEDGRKYPLLITSLSISREADWLDISTPTERDVMRRNPDRYSLSLSSICYGESQCLTHLLDQDLLMKRIHFYCVVNGFRIRAACVVTEAELMHEVGDVPSIDLELEFLGEPEELDLSRWPEWA